MNPNVAKAVADEGGITILAKLARSMNRLVAEEAAGGLWNLSVGEEHKVSHIFMSCFMFRCCFYVRGVFREFFAFFFQGAIAEAGGVKALVDLIFKWSTGGDGVLVCTSVEIIH